MAISSELFILILILGTTAIVKVVESGYIFKEEQLRKCLDLFKRVNTLEDFSENFAQKFIELSQKTDTKDSLAVCINTKTDPVIDVKELKNIIEIGKESDVCSYTFVHNYLTRYNDERFFHPKHCLRDIFQFYVRTVIHLCKRVLLDKMAQVKKDLDFPYLMDTITDLIINTTNEIGSFNAEYYWPVSLASSKQVTIGLRLEALVFSEEILANLKNVPTVRIEHSGDVLKNLDRIRWSCQHLLVYQRDIIYTIAELSEKGYTEPLASLDNAHNSDLFWWLVTAQMCEIIKLVGSNEVSRSSLELTFNNHRDNLEEIEFKSFEFSPLSIRKIVYLKENIFDADGPFPPAPGLFKRLLNRTPNSCKHKSAVRAKVINTIMDRFVTENFLELLGRYLSSTFGHS